jgi:hypothetical protein
MASNKSLATYCCSPMLPLPVFSWCCIIFIGLRIFRWVQIPTTNVLMYPAAFRTRFCTSPILIPRHLIIDVTTRTIADFASCLILTPLIVVISSHTTADSASCSPTWTTLLTFAIVLVRLIPMTAMSSSVHSQDIPQAMIRVPKEISILSIPLSTVVLRVGANTGVTTSPTSTADLLGST